MIQKSIVKAVLVFYREALIYKAFLFLGDEISVSAYVNVNRLFEF